MAQTIEWLKNLPFELQEKILEFASNRSNENHKLMPIEIDGVVYEVPKPVVDLVDGLWSELKIQNE
mgnify:FL=1